MSDTNVSTSTKSRRLRLKISPLMMVVLTVFFGVYFGWVKSILDCVLPQRRIIAKLESLGAVIEYDDQDQRDDAPFGLALIQYYVGDFRDDPLDHVESMFLDANQSLSDDDLALLAELPEIQSLFLRGSHITNGAMQYVAQLPGLEQLGHMVPNRRAPLRHLRRMHRILSRQLRDRLKPHQGFESHFGLEGR